MTIRLRERWLARFRSRSCVFGRARWRAARRARRQFASALANELRPIPAITIPSRTLAIRRFAQRPTRRGLRLVRQFGLWRQQARSIAQAPQILSGESRFARFRREIRGLDIVAKRGRGRTLEAPGPAHEQCGERSAERCVRPPRH
jgi:hypothetical protein